MGGSEIRAELLTPATERLYLQVRMQMNVMVMTVITSCRKSPDPVVRKESGNVVINVEIL